MNTPEALLQRLDAIGASLAADPKAIALLGLGSVGIETERLDRWSDLDFFAIVDPTAKAEYLASLDWLARAAPIAYAFRNTVDGYKVLYDDGVYCEFAVFTPVELETAAYPSARIVWCVDDFDTTLAEPRTPLPPARGNGVDHIVGEALTNLFVGLLRDHRGERMAALRLIQGHALDRVMELAPSLEADALGMQDPFDVARRFEARHPETANDLGSMAQGYERNRESAAAILRFLERHVEVDPAIEREIRALL